MVDSHYVVSPPWREMRPVFKSNYVEAMKWFYSLERMFRRRQPFATSYSGVVNEYLMLGHARPATDEEIKNTPPAAPRRNEP